MKKKMGMFFSAAILVVFLMGCSNTNKLTIRNYVYAGSQESYKPYVSIEENNQFLFTYSGSVSYLPRGSYEMKDDLLILNTEGVTGKPPQYVFKIKNGTLIFQAEQSAEVPEFIEIPDGAVFK